MMVILDRNLPTKSHKAKNWIRSGKRDLAKSLIDLGEFVAARRLLTQSLHKSTGIISAGSLGADGAIAGIVDSLSSLVGLSK